VAVLKPDSDDETPKFFLEKDSNNEENSDGQEESNIINSSEPLTEPIIKKNLKKTRYVHIPSVALGAGIAISCLVLGIFLANFIDMEDSQLLAEISTITNIEKQQNAHGPDALVKNGSPILGSIDAPITLVEFGDYQCSFCKRHFDQTHDLIMKNYVETNKVKIVFKDLIVTPGKDSMYAAHATHCAKDQGMFWKYHYMLYNNWEGESTGWVTTDNLNKFAKNIGLDINKFSKCMSEDKWMELINASQDDANTLGVTGTPSFFLITSWQEADDQSNGITRIHGAQPYDVFKELIDSQLKK
jgi:protein-disulfide isomerase